MFMTKDKDSNMKITVNVGDTSFTAVLFDNKTAEEFYSHLPMTLEMKELNGNEKYYNLGMSLTTKSSTAGHISKGDIKLFGDDCLVLFYEDFISGYSYTNIGYIENTEGLEAVLGNGNVTVGFKAR